MTIQSGSASKRGGMACSAPYHFTLRDQLARVELGHDAFQDLVYDRW